MLNGLVSDVAVMSVWSQSTITGNLVLMLVIHVICRQETPQNISVTDSFSDSMRTKGKSYMSTLDGI